jgi:hypothetical protein
VLLAIGSGTALFVLDGAATGADCSSPTIEYPAGPDGSSDAGPWVVAALVVLTVLAGGSMLVVRRR